MIFNGSKIYHHVTNSARNDKTAFRCKMMTGRGGGGMAGRSHGMESKRKDRLSKKQKFKM
jgi:hypothetical protein